MAQPQDPIQRLAGESRDLYEIASWEPRSSLDAFAVSVWGMAKATLRALVIVLALIILLAQLALGGLGVIADPVIGTIVILSVVPALVLVAYIWYIDVTAREPLSLLVATFLLGVLFASFAAVINAIGIVPFVAMAGAIETTVPALADTGSLLALSLFFFLVVGPVEETVKLLAVRLYAYRTDRFDAVINGAVYGAVAGLGFATIENALYISQSLETGVRGVEAIEPAGTMAAARALAGPGHVLYSAIAGYYLGLAKFNPAYAGPLVVKGLIIAAVLHALYNSLVGPVPDALATAVAPITPPVAVTLFVVLYLSLVAAFLVRKIEAYRHAYRDVGAD